eukprot:gb/GEZN01003282.1/.p1 GENE.gb/GEZN01003282.1/~~gb/GEZN01003282.1/.p1  ORF type:complete len:304 (+),score=56.04 gb/GEZN01003282.1/:679-1590(+)
MLTPQRSQHFVEPENLEEVVSAHLRSLEASIRDGLMLGLKKTDNTALSDREIQAKISRKMKAVLSRGQVGWADPTKRPDDFPPELWHPLAELKDEPGMKRKEKLLTVLKWIEAREAAPPPPTFMRPGGFASFPHPQEPNHLPTNLNSTDILEPRLKKKRKKQKMDGAPLEGEGGVPLSAPSTPGDGVPDSEITDNKDNKSSTPGSKTKSFVPAKKKARKNGTNSLTSANNALAFPNLMAQSMMHMSAMYQMHQQQLAAGGAGAEAFQFPAAIVAEALSHTGRAVESTPSTTPTKDPADPESVV